MTITEVTKQLFDLSADNRFNGERFTRQELKHYITNMMRNSETLKIQNRIVMEINLKDGTWLFTVDKFSDTPDGYDYWIPDTREQEARIWKRLVGA